jgi:hypothetical protein
MAYASLDENEEGLIQQGELADLRLTFPVSEETAAADYLGNLRWDHLVRSNVTRKSKYQG